MHVSENQSHSIEFLGATSWDIRTEGKNTDPYYRLDFREPEIICQTGFQGSHNNEWNNLIFGGQTVYAARSLRGSFYFGMEALLGKRPDGKRPFNSFSSCTHPKD